MTIQEAMKKAYEHIEKGEIGDFCVTVMRPTEEHPTYNIDADKSWSFDGNPIEIKFMKMDYSACGGGRYTETELFPTAPSPEDLMADDWEVSNS